MSDADFGTELRRLRTEAGWSLTDLAKRIHYTKGYLSKVENGVAPPNEALALLCDSELDTGGVLIAVVPRRRRKLRLRTFTVRPSGLPQSTPLFTGRDTELTDVCAMLRERAHHRLRDRGHGGIRQNRAGRTSRAPGRGRFPGRHAVPRPARPHAGAPGTGQFGRTRRAAAPTRRTGRRNPAVATGTRSPVPRLPTRPPCPRRARQRGQHHARCCRCCPATRPAGRW